MKTRILSVLTILSLCFGINAQNINIPDANFKTSLLTEHYIDTNSDSEISASEASAFTGAINCDNQSISDLTGIEAFTNLSELNCSNNSLTSLDVSNNLVLTRIDCDYNQLTSLNVSANTALTRLDCDNNLLTYLNISGNTALSILVCNVNSLISLDLSSNTNLSTLHLFQNKLTTIDLFNNNKLIQVLLDNNKLTGHIDFSTLSVLTDLKINNNGNGLTSVNIATGNNLNMWRFNGTVNSSLICVQTDSGSKPSGATAWVIDDLTTAVRYTSSDCVPVCYITIPDANFKAALIADTSINTDGDAEISCTEASDFTETIYLPYKYISDLTGIEAFTNITGLNCGHNYISNLDLSANTALTYLSLHNNRLSNLDVSVNTALTYLGCNYNLLTSIDASGNTVLSRIDCHNNSLESLDFSTNTALTELHCYENSLTNLNLANGNNTALLNSSFYAALNPDLTCIQVDDAAFSTANWTNIDAATSFSVDCTTYVTIPDANFKAALVGNTAINTDGDTEISTTEAIAFTGAISVYSSYYPITDLTGIEYFTEITKLHAYSNNIASINLSQNTKLTQVLIENNSIVGNIDLSMLTALTDLKINNNDVTSLNIATGNHTNMTRLAATGNPNLTCIEVDDVNFFTLRWSIFTKDATASFSTNCGNGLSVDEFTLNRVLIHPNPVYDLLHINIKKGVLKKITILNTLGQVVLTTTSLETINVSDLKEGIYFLKLTNNKGQIAVQKIIKK